MGIVMNYISARARALKPYVPGEQPQDRRYIKINTNENPYPMSPKAREAAAAALENAALYPDPDATVLRKAVAQVEGVRPEQVFCGNGSDEVLAFCFAAFFDPDRPVLFPDSTYSFYPVYADFFGISYERVALDEGFGIDPARYDRANGGVIFPNPNAPTGRALSADEIRALAQMQRGRGVLIVDEAYVAFGAQSVMPLIEEFDNLVVVRTFSKSHSMAGMRVGYAVAQESLIAGLNAVKNSFNSYVVDRAAAAGGAAALLDTEYNASVVEKIICTRERTVKELKKLGFTMPESKANFVFITHERMRAEELYRKLREKGILTRYFAQARIDNYLRVSIGTDDEMDAFLKAVREILAEK